MSSEFSINRIRDRGASPIYLAQLPSGNSADPSGSAVKLADAGRAPEVISYISPAAIPTLKRLVARDIKIIDDMMLAEQLLMIRYMIDITEKGDLTKNRRNADVVAEKFFNALEGKFKRPADIVRELAANNPKTKGTFGAASNYYFNWIYDVLDTESPKDLLVKLDELKAKLGDLAAKFPSDINDPDFEKKYASALIDIYKDPSAAQNKDTVFRLMIVVEILLVRHMVEIAMAGRLARQGDKGWKEEDRVEAVPGQKPPLEEITEPRVVEKIRNRANGADPLAKKVFFAAVSNEYFETLDFDLEEATKDIGLEGIIDQMEGELDFRGISIQGLQEILGSSELSNRSKLLDSFRLSEGPVRPQAALNAPDRGRTIYDEQRAKVLIALSRWLKGIEALLNAQPKMGALAFAVGDAEDVSPNPEDADDIPKILANRHRVFLFDRVETPWVPPYINYVATDKRRFFKACEKILANPKRYKDLLETAEELYENKKSDILKHEEKVLERSKVTRSLLLNDTLDFKESLRAEIDGRRLSFASMAIAQAHSQNKAGYMIPPEYQEKLEDDGYFLKGIPKELMGTFLSVYMSDDNTDGFVIDPGKFRKLEDGSIFLAMENIPDKLKEALMRQLEGVVFEPGNFESLKNGSIVIKGIPMNFRVIPKGQEVK